MWMSSQRKWEVITLPCDEKPPGASAGGLGRIQRFSAPLWGPPAIRMGMFADIALLGLGSFDWVDAIGCQALILGLGDAERPVRDAAFDALVRLGKTDLTIVDALFEALGYAQADTRQAVCHGFGMLGTSAPREVVDALRATLHDSNERVRLAAVENLGLLGRADEETVAELLRFLSYPEPEVDRTNAEDLRRAAARSLARIGYFKKEIVDELLALLKAESHDENQKEEAIEYLVTLGRASPSALAMIRDALEAPDTGIRNGAGRCLIELGYTTPAAVRNLIEETLHYDPVHQGHLRARAVDRLAQLGQVDYEITDWLIRAFEKNGGSYGYDQAGTLASVLGQIGYRQPAAVTSLVRMAGQPDRDGRLSAVEALGRVGQAGSEVLEALIQTLRDPNEYLRRATARSLGQLSINTPANLRAVLVALNRALYDQEDDVCREALGSIRKP